MKTIGLISDKKSKKLFLLPSAVKVLVNNKITVNIPEGYGSIFNINDSEYASVGATILASKNEVIANSDVVCKVDIFTKSEIEKMNGKIAVTMANYLANVDMLYYMLKNNVTGLAWNNLATPHGYVFFPEVEKIKGELAVKTIIEGMKKGLSKPKEKVVYPKPAELLILNATFAGVAAVKFALANGFNVMMLDHDKDYLKSFSNSDEIVALTTKHKTKFSVGDATFENLQKVIAKKNAFINTTINPEDRTKLRITKEMANSMPAGSILYDASTEYGYAFAWIKRFVKADLEYVKFNKVFYVAVEDNTDLFAKQYTDIISIKSVYHLITLAEQGQGNSTIADTVICNKGKVIDNKVKTQLTLY